MAPLSDVKTANSTGKVTGIGLVADRIASIGVGDDRIAAAAVRGFDGDVVTYSADTAPNDATLAALDPRGLPVLDMHGDLLGALADLTITHDGMIDTISLHDGGSLNGARLRVIGSYAAIVSIEAPGPR